MSGRDPVPVCGRNRAPPSSVPRKRLCATRLTLYRFAAKLAVRGTRAGKSAEYQYWSIAQQRVSVCFARTTSCR